MLSEVGQSPFSNPDESIGIELIESELFREIPESVSEPFRVIPNQSEKRFLLCLIKNNQNLIQLFHQTRYEQFFESVWNGSETGSRMTRNEFQYDTFARVLTAF